MTEYYSESEKKNLLKKWKVFSGFDIAAFVLLLLNFIFEIVSVVGFLIAVKIPVYNSGGDVVNEIIDLAKKSFVVLGFMAAFLVVGFVIMLIGLVLIIFSIVAICNRKELKRLDSNWRFVMALIGGIVGLLLDGSISVVIILGILIVLGIVLVLTLA